MSSHIVLSSRSFQLLLSHSMPKKPCQQQHSSWSQCSPAFDDVYSVAWERKACGLFLRATATAFVTCGSARPLSKAKPCPKDDGSTTYLSTFILQRYFLVAVPSIKYRLLICIMFLVLRYKYRSSHAQFYSKIPWNQSFHYYYRAEYRFRNNQNIKRDLAQKFSVKPTNVL